MGANNSRIALGAVAACLLPLLLCTLAARAQPAIGDATVLEPLD